MSATDVPWVIEGEPGPATLTKWEDDKPIGYEPWCGTCGWHGVVQPLIMGDSEAWEAAGTEGHAHAVETGHDYEDGEPL